MTTMQEALGDRFLTNNPKVANEEASHYFADLMQRSYSNPKYDSQDGLALGNTSAHSGIPSRHQNKIRSGRASRRAANNQRDLQRVGGIHSSRQPGLSIVKAIYAPPSKELCRTERTAKNNKAGK